MKTELPGGITLEVQHEVGYLTLNRPEQRNPQTPATWRSFAALPQHLPDSVRVLVVRGAGGNFSAGLDRAVLTDPGPDGLAALTAQSDGALEQTLSEFQAGFWTFRDHRWISIAVVEGHAIGAGFQLALACDVRLADAEASMAMKEVSLGLVPDLTGTQPLLECVGYSRALEICVSGRAISATEAQQLSLVEAVGAVNDLLTAKLTELAATPRGVQRELKALFRAESDDRLKQQAQRERAAQIRRLRALAGGN